MLKTEIINTISFYWILFALLIFPFLFFIKQPYGRHVRQGWGTTLPNRTGWILMESPSLLIFVIILILLPHQSFTTCFLVILWISHYIHRTLIFPFRIKTRGKRMPVLIILSGFFFNLVNATINGQSLLTQNEQLLDHDVVRFVIGFLLFGFGMFINLYSDYYLISLRINQTNGYQVPQKFLFKWISCPNYFGEIIEWTGFAVLAWNPAALSFVVWTVVNLVPRAIDHHKWYLKNFQDYSKKRKAIIPFIL